MSSVGQDRLTPSQQQGENWRGTYPAPVRDRGGPSWGLLTAGLVAVGLGVAAWYYFGPDIRRYLKIERM